MTTPELLPTPRSVEWSRADFAMAPADCIRCSTAAVGRRLAELLRQEHKTTIPVASDNIGPHQLVLGTPAAAPAADLEPEAYRLHVGPDGVQLDAGSPTGLLWGAMTLRQLVQRNGRGLVVRGARIHDRPHYRWRGFQIDSGRAPNSIAQIKRIIRICSAFKLNFLLFREGDDELNAVRYRSVPLGSQNPYALTMDQVRELSDYAAACGITLIPEIESLGHSTAKGRHYPELVSGGFEHTYEGVGTHIRKSHLAPCDARTRDLLRAVYAEWLQALQPPMLHLGLDEVRLPVEQQAEHLRQLLDIVQDCAAASGVDVMPMVWSDAPPTPAPRAERVIRCLWSYATEGGPVAAENEHLKRQGLAELLAPGCRQPVLMAGGSASGHTPYSKSPSPAACANLATWARCGVDYDNVLGLFAVQWSGNMLDDWLPDFLAAAEYGWSPPATPPDIDAAHERIRRHLAALPDAASPDPAAVDRHAWDAIWLRDGRWDQEVLPQ